MGANLSNTIVILPSYNEARAIGAIVRDIVKMGMTALVIDDGSIDDTGSVALDAGALVIRNKHNCGKGCCVRIGIDHVMEKTKFEWIIIMDGDGQHHTEDIPALINATNQDGYVDIVNGNRMFNTETMPFIRYVTNRFTSWVVSKLCDQYIPDSQCGYRIVKVEALKHLELKSDKYDIESEMLIQAAEKKMIIRSVPIQTIYGEEKSEINKIRDTLRFFALVIRHKIKKNGT